MSNTSAVFPIVRALQAATEFGKATTGWSPRGEGAELQARYIPLLALLERQLQAFSPEELKAVASKDVDVINSFLKENGFDIALEPFQDEESFGVASVMSVLVKWMTAGEITELESLRKYYKAVLLKDDLQFTTVPGHPHVIAHVKTQNGDVVHMTKADNMIGNHLDLLEKCKALGESGVANHQYDELVFPMVDLNQEVDISFFMEMNFQGTGADGGEGTLAIKQAKQQTKFQMNNIGAKAESAAAFEMALECCFMTQQLVLDEPFYVWMTRDGLDMPYFAGYINRDDWKDPGELK